MIGILTCLQVFHVSHDLMISFSQFIAITHFFLILLRKIVQRQRADNINRYEICYLYLLFLLKSDHQLKPFVMTISLC